MLPAFPSPLSCPPSPSSYSAFPSLDDFDPPLYTLLPSVDHFLPPPYPSFDGVVRADNVLPHQEGNAGITTNYILSHEDNAGINTDGFLSLEEYLSVDGYGNADFLGGRDWRLNLPPGVKFRPTDEELITHYLKPHFLGRSFDNGQPIACADVYNYEPHQLLELGEDHGDGKRYFYSRIKKNKSKTDRSIKSKKGNWKPTQKAKPVRGENGITIGYKTPLAYHKNNKKTQWLMQEFKLEARPSHHSSHQLVLAVVYYHHHRRRGDH